MTERVIGPTGSPRRRRTLLLPLVAMIALGLYYAAGAQAVHGENFQLDGDVLASTTTDIGPTDELLDWDSLFDPSGNEKPLPTDFTASGFDKDFSNNGANFITSDGTTFATGSKDTLPISGWQCNFDNNVNSKIDVMNAYAAEYTAPNGDEIIYFALERNVNTGDANVGFWFLQDDVGCSSTGGAVDFTGGHMDGDLLVVSEFSGGGTVSTINVYEWEGDDATGSLNPTPVATGADCRGATFPAVDSVCGVANTDDITTPWLTAAKSAVGNALPEAQFFEGGVNLTAEGLGGRCFNTFIGDTRSSTSLTATLFDYSLGVLGECTSGIVTTPQTGAGDPIVSVNIPTAASGNTITVRDRAVITVGGVDEFGGTVTFSLCGPLALTSTSNCQTGGVQIGNPVTVVGDAGTATVFSTPTATLTSVGRYCWRAVYSGDAGTGVPGSTDPADATNTSECFTVNPITPTLTTQASCSATPCVLSSVLSDTATLTGTARQPGTGGLGGAETIAPGSINPTTAGALAGGNISFTAFGPDSCSTTAMATTTRAVSGDGTYPKTAAPDNQAAVSFTPTAVGEYIFVASYDGSSPNTNAQPGDTCANQPSNEKVTVTGSASLSTAQRWLPNDTAHVTSQAGTTLAGTVTFTLHNSIDCTGAAVLTQAKNVVTDANAGGTANNRFVSTTNTTFFVTEANDTGAWSWKVSYNDTSLADPADECESTSAFTLVD